MVVALRDEPELSLILGIIQIGNLRLQPGQLFDGIGDITGVCKGKVVRNTRRYKQGYYTSKSFHLECVMFCRHSKFKNGCKD
jgi:hypothetical protein